MREVPDIIIVTGSRFMTPTDLPELPGVTPKLVVHGACRGADRVVAKHLVDRGARERTVPYKSEHGPKGGPMRNQEMVDRAVQASRNGYVVEVWAFPCPRSSGTWDCVRRARQQGLVVREFYIRRGER